MIEAIADLRWRLNALERYLPGRTDQEANKWVREAQRALDQIQIAETRLNEELRRLRDAERTRQMMEAEHDATHEEDEGGAGGARATAQA